MVELNNQLFNIVKDEEILYRCLFYNKDCPLFKIEDDEVKISSAAFADRYKKPSVDRAILCENNPRYTQKSSKDGVVSLECVNIRLIKDVPIDGQKPHSEKYHIDVIPDPKQENEAHAQIEPSPEYQNKSRFKKVQERLALIATQRLKRHGWAIAPYELRD